MVFEKGHIPWNKGLTFEEDSRIPRPWLGKKRSKETINKLRKSHTVQKVPFRCPICGKIIHLTPYEAKNRKYCSHKCSDKAKRKRIEKVCQHCGQTYEVIQSVANLSKYCSRLCQNKALAQRKKEQAKVNLICKACGKTFTVTKSQLKVRDPKYCSIKCANSYPKTPASLEQLRSFRQIFYEEHPEVRRKISKSLKQFYEEHPEARDKLREYRLKQIVPSADTSIEVALQDELERRGIKYHKHLPVLGICQPDIVFPNKKIAVFADGDYWHTKDKRAIRKDQFQNQFLRDNDWDVLRFWGHEIREDVVGCVDQIVEHVKT